MLFRTIRTYAAEDGRSTHVAPTFFPRDVISHSELTVGPVKWKSVGDTL